MTKFEWQATEGAPKNYPMEITSGSLVYHDGSGSLYVPNGALLHNGWGKGRSSHVVGEDFKPLPNRLTIRFFSYTEDQFYEGDFALPYEKILALFQAGFYSYVDEEHITYDNIVVGVAPGGAVSVWLWGYEKITEVFFGQAEKIDVEWSHFTSATKVTREEYIKTVINGSLKTPERIAALHKDGIPFRRWAAWQPLFTNFALLDQRITIINYYNGEQDYINYPLEKAVAASTRAIPKFLRLYWENPEPEGKDRSLSITFDEAEITQAFQTLSQGNRPLQLEFRIEEIDGKNDFSIRLRHEKEEIIFEKVHLKTYGVRDTGPD